MWSVGSAPHSYSGTQDPSIPRYSHLQQPHGNPDISQETRANAERDGERMPALNYLSLAEHITSAHFPLAKIHLWFHLTLRGLGSIVKLCTQKEKASLVTFNQSVFWCSSQIFESAKWKTNCDLFVVTLSTGSAAAFLHLHLLVFISRFVGRRGVRKGEKKNHLKCIFPRTLFLGRFSGDSHLYFILYPHSHLESFLQKGLY